MIFVETGKLSAVIGLIKLDMYLIRMSAVLLSNHMRHSFQHGGLEDRLVIFDCLLLSLVFQKL